MQNKPVAVVGAGSWGTALAILLAENGMPVSLWGHDSKNIEEISRYRTNEKYLAGFFLPQEVVVTNQLNHAVEGCEKICMVVPSHAYRSVFSELYNCLGSKADIISAVKGIENDSLMTMSQVMEDVRQSKSNWKSMSFSVLSGPSFAKEVAQHIPTAVTIGCENIAISQCWQKIFSTRSFRVYTSKDVIGLEISAALKNIIAIATGICDGLGYGLNTRAALITRGLAEMSRLGVAMGADPATFAGLSGIGDLVLTCTGSLSRNRTLGLRLAEGKTLLQIQQETLTVAEGVKTTRAAQRLAEQKGIELPILDQVYAILYSGKSCEDAARDLLIRELKIEKE